MATNDAERAFWSAGLPVTFGSAGQGDVGQGYTEEVIDAANAGDTSWFTAADWDIVRRNPGYTTARARRAQAAGGGTGGDGDGDGDGDGGGGGGGGAPAYDPYAAMRAFYAQQENTRQRNAIAVVQALLAQYNLSGLYETIVNYIKEGYDANTVMVLIRTTPEYQRRFPAMQALAAKGRAISEAEYINYEQTASGLERRYGLPEGMLMGKVTDLLTGEVSATELNDRVVLASAASIQAPPELRQQFQQYYGIDQGGLTAYFLDPDVATPMLEKRYASAIIGREAATQGIGIDVYGAENLQQLGISREQARAGFAEVARAGELTAGRGETVSQEELISGTLAQNEEAQKRIERTRQSRLGRFEGGGGFAAGQGQVALGSAATR